MADYSIKNVHSQGPRRDTGRRFIDDYMPQCVFMRYRPICKTTRREHHAPQGGRTSDIKLGLRYIGLRVNRFSL